MKKKFHYHKQETEYTCGAASLKMILEYFGIEKTEKELMKMLKTNEVRGSLTKDFFPVLKKLKLNYLVKSNATIRELKKFQKQGYMIIVCYYLPEEKCDHYAVLRKIDFRFIHLFDPWYGPEHKLKIHDFEKLWHSDFNVEKQIRWALAIKK
ncbi:MAG: cysteine peptidase family C39 domain-containing protein [Candidatus Pacearchaeota archaeon]